MTEISFAKLIPSGNPTIIITSPLSSSISLPNIAASLMDPLHLQAEQVGALDFNASLPHLQMMGGEFCVNATRSVALLLALQGKLTPLLVSTSDGEAHCWHGALTISGADAPLTCLVAPKESLLITALSLVQHPLPAFVGCVAIPTSRQMFVAVSIPCKNTFLLHTVDLGITLVSLPGITHLLVDTALHPMPKNWRTNATLLRKRYGLLNEAASGVIWFSSEQGRYSIQPAVAVQATGSEHLETACGSGSLAMAFMLRQKASAAPVSEQIFAIYQPSGKALTISFDEGPMSAPSATAWISGEVSLVAQGTAYIF